MQGSVGRLGRLGDAWWGRYLGEEGQGRAVAAFSSSKEALVARKEANYY